MARPLRIEYPGAYYHVTSRGNERKAIFRTDKDRVRFLELLGRAVEQFHLRVHAYALMQNHYHLLVETPRAGLNRALRYLNGVYTQAFNRRHQRVGHLFQGRYKAILVDRDSYLLELSRYIHLNPWRIRKSEDPFTYRWSSLGAYTGRTPIPPWLTVREVLGYFGSKDMKGYRGFVLDGIKNGIKTPWDEVQGQAMIGPQEFVEEMAERHLRGKEDTKGEVTGIRDIVGIRPEEVLREVKKYFRIEEGEIRKRGQRYTEPRYLTSYLLRQYCLMSLREIGERVGLHYSAVGNAVRRVRENPTRAMARSRKELETKIKH